MENLLHYIALFILVFVVRIFKLKKEHKQNFNENWQKALYVSLDLIYTASGIVITLLLNLDSKWVSAIFVIYIIFVIVSSQLEMANSDEFSDKSKTIIHSLIIIFIFIFSILTYTYIIPNVENEKNIKSVVKPKKIVIIPYTDESLKKHIGKNDITKRRFLFISEQNTANIDSAKVRAIKELKIEIKPLYKEYNMGITIYFDEILIQNLNNQLNY